MAKDLASLFAFRDLRAYPLAAVHIIMATRLCILFGQAGRDPLPDLAVRMRSMDAARRVERLARAIQQDWPDPFLIHRPCSVRLTPDEALLGDLVVAAAQGDDATAITILRDMLPAETARHLFESAIAATAAIQLAQCQPHRPSL